MTYPQSCQVKSPTHGRQRVRIEYRHTCQDIAVESAKEGRALVVTFLQSGDEPLPLMDSNPTRPSALFLKRVCRHGGSKPRLLPPCGLFGPAY